MEQKIARRATRLLNSQGGRFAALSRVSAAFISVVGIAFMSVALTGLSSASANAANPSPTTTGTATVNPDGTVNAQLSGTWTWPGQTCAGRYGEGWAVDWWGISSTATPNPSFSLTNATEVTAPGVTTTGTISPAGAILITSTNSYFHVAQFYGGETVNSPSTCTDTGSGTSATSSGSWSASATYPSVADLPAQLCVNIYDEHGSEGKTSGSAKDYSPSADSDNSIQTNAFDPANGAGYCVSLHAPITQSLVGHIYLCNNGTATTTEVPGGTLSATGAQTVASTSNPLGPVTVASGSYTMDATSPANYTLTGCGGSAVIGTPATTASESVTVPSGGTGTGTFYVTPITQSLVGHIYLCNNGTATTTEVPGGTLSATGAQTVASTSNPLGPVTVASGSYTMDATSPANYTLTGCGGSAVIGTPATTASESVTVPSGGTGTGTFYVTPITQSLVGHIYLCNNGTATTTEVPGGTLSATGAQTVASTSNPLGPVTVASGSYTMDATSPANYTLTGCGGSAVIGTPATTASESVTVPSGGTGTGTFYVTPNGSAKPSITLGVTKTNDANGSGTYAQSETATAPGENVPFRVVVTNTSTVSIVIDSLTDSWPSQAAFSPTCASTVVGTTLAPGASVTCDFTVDNYAPAAGASLTDTVSVTGCQVDISDNCNTGTSVSTVIVPSTTPAGSINLAVTKTNDANGSGTYAQSETANAAGENVPFRVVVTNPSSEAVVIGSLTDTWPNQVPFSPTCASAVVGTTLAPGASTTCDFTVNDYSPAVGSSLTDTVTVTGCAASDASNCGTFPATSVVQTIGPVTAAASGKLAFTGAAHLKLFLEIGFSLLSLGSFLMWRNRRRATSPLS